VRRQSWTMLVLYAAVVVTGVALAVVGPWLLAYAHVRGRGTPRLRGHELLRTS
jgi:hypothetical protein